MKVKIALLFLLLLIVRHIAWENLLEHKRNREECPKSRNYGRNYERERILKDHRYAITAQLGPFALAIPESKPSTVTSVSTNWDFEVRTQFYIYWLTRI